MGLYLGNTQLFYNIATIFIFRKYGREKWQGIVSSIQVWMELLQILEALLNHFRPELKFADIKGASISIMIAYLINVLEFFIN